MMIIAMLRPQMNDLTSKLKNPIVNILAGGNKGSQSLLSSLIDRFENVLKLTSLGEVKSLKWPEVLNSKISPKAWICKET